MVIVGFLIERCIHVSMNNWQIIQLKGMYIFFQNEIRMGFSLKNWSFSYFQVLLKISLFRVVEKCSPRCSYFLPKILKNAILQRSAPDDGVACMAVENLLGYMRSLHCSVCLCREQWELYREGSFLVKVGKDVWPSMAGVPPVRRAEVFLFQGSSAWQLFFFFSLFKKSFKKCPISVIFKRTEKGQEFVFGDISKHITREQGGGSFKEMAHSFHQLPAGQEPRGCPFFNNRPQNVKKKVSRTSHIGENYFQPSPPPPPHYKRGDFRMSVSSCCDIGWELQKPENQCATLPQEYVWVTLPSKSKPL